jgi:hypothetical protein
MREQSNEVFDSERFDVSGEKKITLGRRNNRAANVAAIREATRRMPGKKQLRENIMRLTADIPGGAVDIFNEASFPVHNPTFDWRKVREKLSGLRESENTTGWTQLTRAGIQSLVDKSYETADTTFEDFCHVINSTRREELYAPIQGIGFPGEVSEGGIYPEAKASGLDIKILNRKYGEIFPYTMELEEDDQTGQMSSQVGLIGEYLKQVYEVIVYAKMASVAPGTAVMQYGGLVARPTETKPSYEANYPWAPPATPLKGGIANVSGYTRPTAYAALTQATIQSALIAMANQVNQLGLRMNVKGNRIIASAWYEFDLATLLHSTSYASNTTATAAGSTGGAFGVNPIKGILQPTIGKFVFDQNGIPSAISKRVVIVDDTKPFFIVQMREAASTVQEAKDSGDSFNRDVTRTKGRTRGNADIIDPRFMFQLSDGSA